MLQILSTLSLFSKFSPSQDSETHSGQNFNRQLSTIFQHSHAAAYLLLILAVVLSCTHEVKSQVVIGGWNTSTLPGGVGNFGPSPFPATAMASNVTVGGITRGAGVGTGGTAAARGWGGTWTAADATSAISGNQFFTFTVKANVGYTLSLSTLNPFDYRRSGTGPASGLIQYQINAGAYSTVATVSFPSTSSSGASLGSTNLSVIPALQNLPSTSTVTFRIVPYSATGGTFYIYDVGNSTANDLAVNGFVNPACPTITFTGTPTNTCTGANNGQIAVSSVSGGTGPYMYSKDNGANYQAGATFSGLAAGSYDVVVKDANGCTSGATAVVVGTHPPPSCSITGSPTICNNQTEIYTAPAGMSAYNWEILYGAGGIIIGPNTNQSVSVKPAGQSFFLKLTVTDANGCTSECFKTIFNLQHYFATAITATPNPVCFGVMLDLSASVSASSTVSWTGNGIGNATSNPTTALPTATGLQTYSVTESTPDGCFNTVSINVMVNPLPSCSISGLTSVCNGGSVTLDAGGGYSSYAWSDGGGGGQTANFTNITTNTTYTVTVTDANGCTNTCNITITVNALPTVTCPIDAIVCSGTAPFLLTGGSPSGGTYGGPGVSANMFDASLAGSGAHTISYIATDGNGCSNTCTFTLTVQNCNVEFSGKILWEHDDVSGVKDATVNLTGSATGSAVTDVNGDFLITTAATMGNFTLKPVKNINKFNGVTSGDATAIQQHVTLITPITDPYKLVCADVNKSNSISTLDASLIVQSLLGNPAANAIFNTSWRFVPSSHVMALPPWGFPEQRSYTGISGPQTNQDFFGMKIGDVTASFANPANFGAGVPLVLRAQDQLLKSGESFTVAFSADQIEDLAAFQFALTFDPAYLQFQAIEPLSGLSLTADAFGLYNIDNGEVRAVWAQATGVDVAERAPAFQLRFTSLQSGTKLSEVLHLNAAVLPGLAYTSKLEESAVELQFSATSATNDPTAELLQLKVQPNPFRNATTVSFSLPEAAEAQLRVLDLNGRELLRINNTYPAGNNSETLRLDGLSASGVLTCELVTPFGVATRKLVKAD